MLQCLLASIIAIETSAIQVNRKPVFFFCGSLYALLFFTSMLRGVGLFLTIVLGTLDLCILETHGLLFWEVTVF